MSFLASLKFRAIVAGITALFVMMGLTAMLIYLGSAVYLAFALILSPPLAALAAAGSALFFCFLAVLVARIVNNRAARRMPAAAAPSAATGEMGEMLGARAHELFQQRPGVGIAASLAAGFAVGMSPRLRALLREIVLG
ncbi:MAG TPA: hypothetical protein VGG10_23360 [Rhizomicrobium sp.]|jgi:hypothetical protein